MHLLVTGGLGFVGSAFVRRRLATTDDRVTVLDAGTYAASPENLASVADDPRLTVRAGDVTRRPDVRAALEGVEAVVHLAAETHVDRSLLSSEPFVRTNCVGTDLLCEEAARAGVARLLHVSTDEVYGPIEEGAFDEEARLRPSSPYAASKAGSDLIALAHHRSAGLDVVVARSSNQYGPHQFPEKLIPLFVTTLLTGGQAPLYGDGTQVRDWLPVDDNAAALDLVLAAGVPGEVYNVAAHQERTNRQVADAVVAALGVDPRQVVHVADRPGHDRRYAVTTQKLATLGPWRAAGFEASLEATVRWYVDHRSWWEPLLPRVRNR